jgi:hypothetical protein
MLCLPSEVFFNTCDIDRVNAVFRKAKRWRITQYIYYVEDFIEIAQIKLFKCIISNDTISFYLTSETVTTIFAHEDTSTNSQIIKPHSPEERT